MNTATPRSAQPARPLPEELRPGDQVTRKPGLVVIGPVWSKPAFYLARDADGRYHVLHRCEIDTIEQTEHPAHPVEDNWGDAAAPAVTVAQAEPVEVPVIEWGPEDKLGDFQSTCGRFLLVHVAGQYTVHDTKQNEITELLALRDDAIHWCQRRVAHEREAKPNGSAHGNLVDAKPAVAVTATTSLEWAKPVSGRHIWLSNCSRFRIVPSIVHVTHDEPTVFHAVDTRFNTRDLRYSPDTTFAACKAWCEGRARMDAIKAGGVEHLIDKDIPF